MEQFKWLDLAVKFRIGTLPTRNEPRQVYIDERQQRDGSILWACVADGFVLSKDGCFVYEVQPSSRTDKFIERTRFKTKEDAANLFNEVKRKGDVQFVFEDYED